MVTPWYGTPAGHGVAVAVETLVLSLREQGWQPVVVIPVGDGWRPRWSTGQHGERIVRLPLRAWPGLREPRSAVGFLLRLPVAVAIAARLRLAGIRVAHLHFCVPDYGVLSAILRLFGMRLIVTFHGSEVMSTMDTPPLSRILPRVARRASRLAAVSKELGRVARGKLPGVAGRISVVPNVLPKAFAESVDRPERPSKVSGRVLFVGHLSRAKGPDILVRAFIQIHARRSEATLELVGTGPLAEPLAAEVRRLGLDRVVRFSGRLPHADLITRYAEAPVVVVPSRHEGFSLVAIEAALLRCAVVASRVGGLPEVVGHEESGLLFPAEDAEALADALIRLLSDPGLAGRMGDAGRKRVIERNLPASAARRYGRLYARMAQPARARP